MILDAPPVTEHAPAAAVAEKEPPKVDAAPAPTKPTPAKKVTIADKPALPADAPDLKQLAAAFEQEMEVALPDFYVEMTRDWHTRVVRTPQHALAQISLRTLDFPQNGQVRVEPDETLGHFAEWLQTSTQRLRNLNRLSHSEPIRIEQPLLLTFENVTPEEFHRRRLEYHQGIEEDFYNNYSVGGETVYKVKRGENIWIICNREFEIPYWLIKRYNPQADLLRLTAGQELIVPIVEPKNGETVVNEKL